MILTFKNKLWLVLVGVLIVINLAVGLIAYRKLGRLDREYSLVIDRIIPFEDRLRIVSLQASRTLVCTMLYANNSSPQADQAQLIQQSGAVSEGIFELMQNEVFPSAALQQEFNGLRAKRRLWRSHLATYMDLIQRGNRTESGSVLSERVYPSLLDYLLSLERFGEHYQETASAINQDLTQQTESSRKLVFGLSFVPTLVLFVVPLIILTFGVMFVVYVILKPANQHDSRTVAEREWLE